MNPIPAIELHSLTVSYDNKPALWNTDYTLPEGVLAGIIGPNGSGKSTMLKSIMGLVQPASGYVKIFGQPLDAVRQRVAYVPQRSSVDWDFPVTVLDVVLMGRYRPGNLFRRSSAHDREIAMECIRKVQLEPFLHRQIARLSGGQQQRVFIARALAQQADLYLLDEPFAGVDAATEAAIMDLLREMRDQGRTVVVVHHDLQSVAEYFEWLVMVNTRLVAAGTTADVFTAEKLQQTYGGSLSILSQVGELIRQQAHPVRETPRS
jgi:manganese/zinc/iron transport system ATP- binding protein